MAEPTVDMGYEVVTDTISVLMTPGEQTFTLSAPSGKKPVAAGHRIHVAGGAYPFYVGDYPDGTAWKFVFLSEGPATDVDLYVVCEYA